MKKKHRLLISFLFFFFTIVAILIWFLSIDVPHSSSFTLEQENQRITSIGTLEKTQYLENRILSISLYFSDIEKTQAIVDVDINIKVEEEEIFNTTFIFILPYDVELYYPEGLEIESKPYAKVVYYPFSIDNQTSLKTCYVRFLWPSFSKNIGFGKWAFDIDCNPFHFLFDEEGEDFISLNPTSSSNFYWLPIKTEVSLSNELSLVDFHPGTDQNFERSVTWIELEPWFSSHVTGIYESKGDRSLLQSIDKLLFFLLGGFASLFLKEIYSLVKHSNDNK